MTIFDPSPQPKSRPRRADQPAQRTPRRHGNASRAWLWMMALCLALLALPQRALATVPAAERQDTPPIDLPTDPTLPQTLPETLAATQAAELAAARGEMQASGNDVIDVVPGAVPDAANAAAWLEPRGVNVVDLVGLVPDSHLQGGIINYETGTGMLIYQSGSRVGNSVTINAAVSPRYFTYGQDTYTQVTCLSQHAAYDQWPSTAPASSVSIFASGRNINSAITALNYAPAGQVLPSSGASAYLRYPRGATVDVAAANPFVLPANNGCALILRGRHTNITVTYRVTAPQQINVTPLGSQTFNAHTYIGTGQNGILSSLNGQMNSRFGSRHEKWPMAIPAGADYVLVNFAPQPVDPYASIGNPANVGVAGTASYRFEGSGLSVDHVSMIGLPLKGQWQDSDQAGGEYLNYMPNPSRFAAPEMFIPPSVPFDPCMQNGGCSGAILDAVGNTTYPVTLYYYRIDRISGSTLERIPLRAVGKGWNGAVASASETAQAGDAGVLTLAPAEIEAIVQQGRRVYLPRISNPAAPAPPPVDDPTGCPCGWFDANGRMFDFIPRP